MRRSAEQRRVKLSIRSGGGWLIALVDKHFPDDEDIISSTKVRGDEKAAASAHP